MKQYSKVLNCLYCNASICIFGRCFLLEKNVQLNYNFINIIFRQSGLGSWSTNYTKFHVDVDKQEVVM